MRYIPQSDEELQEKFETKPFTILAVLYRIITELYRIMPYYTEVSNEL